jgi:hypothetical protein
MYRTETITLASFIAEYYLTAALSMPITDTILFRISRDSEKGGAGGGTPL